MKNHILSLLIALFSCCILCAGTDGTNSEDFKRLPHFTNAAMNFKKLLLYEGLPHQMFESELLGSELKSKNPINIEEHWFYRRPLDIVNGDKSKLLKLLSQPNTYRAFQGYKLCGGFHPDYCVAIEGDGRLVYFLICFGCREIKMHDGKFELYADLTDNGYLQLKDLLSNYSDERPSSSLLDFINE